jgi:hypothetical protein
MEDSNSFENRRRLNLDLTPEAYVLLQKLAEAAGKNMTEVLRTGLVLYGPVQAEAKPDCSLGVV